MNLFYIQVGIIIPYVLFNKSTLNIYFGHLIYINNIILKLLHYLRSHYLRQERFIRLDFRKSLIIINY